MPAFALVHSLSSRHFSGRGRQTVWRSVDRPSFPRRQPDRRFSDWPASPNLTSTPLSIAVRPSGHPSRVSLSSCLVEAFADTVPHHRVTASECLLVALYIFLRLVEVLAFYRGCLRCWPYQVSIYAPVSMLSFRLAAPASTSSLPTQVALCIEGLSCYIAKLVHFSGTAPFIPLQY